MPTATLFQTISPIAKAAFVICIWLVLLSFLVSLWKAWQRGWANLQRLHQIPCSRCAFFTGEYQLKCPLHPYKALNEAAINCLDYESSLLQGSNVLS